MKISSSLSSFSFRIFFKWLFFCASFGLLKQWQRIYNQTVCKCDTMYNQPYLRVCNIRIYWRKMLRFNLIRQKDVWKIHKASFSFHTNWMWWTLHTGILVHSSWSFTESNNFWFLARDASVFALTYRSFSPKLISFLLETSWLKIVLQHFNQISNIIFLTVFSEETQCIFAESYRLFAAAASIRTACCS